jgi:hypothetical protein
MANLKWNKKIFSLFKAHQFSWWIILMMFKVCYNNIHQQKFLSTKFKDLRKLISIKFFKISHTWTFSLLSYES